MFTNLKKLCGAVSLSAVALILMFMFVAVAPAGAAARHKHHAAKVKAPCRNVLRHLGLYKPSRLSSDAPLGTAAKLKKAFADKKFQKIVQRAFDEAKLGPVAPNLIAAVAALPDDAQPREVPVGAKLDWMAYRRHGKARVMSDACWAGKGPFKAWTFSVPGGPDGNVDLIVPVPCGNVSRVEPPTCVLNVDKSGDPVILDMTGSRAGGVPIVSYGSKPELAQSPPGRFQAAAPKCDPGATCPDVDVDLWAVDALGFRSAPGGQCVYRIPGKPLPPVCQLKVTYDKNVFHVDATGSGVAVQSIAVNGSGPEGAAVQWTMTGEQRTTDISYTPTKSGDWTFTGDVLGVNGLHSAPGCSSMVRVCVPPTARIAQSPAYSCETRQLGIDVNGSSEHRVVTVTGPNGTETLSGNGPTWAYDVKRSGHYAFEVTADDAICPENKATASTVLDVAPFGDTARWSLRVFGAYARSSADQDRVVLNAGTAVEEGRKVNLGAHHGGFGAGLEYRSLHGCDLSRWGIALDAIRLQLDTHLLVDQPAAWGRVEDKVAFTPVLLSLNYHLTPGRRADLFIGPSVGYAFLDGVSFHTLGNAYTENFQDDFTYGVNLGLDVPFGSEHQYAFTAGLRQLFVKAKASGTNSFNLDINPTIATAGIAFRFR